MTKKFLHTSKEINGKKCKSEFIIPDIFAGQSRLIGLETGRKYDVGHIVYTGVELTVSEVLDKAEEQQKLGFWKKRKAKKNIQKYLLQIKAIKIGSFVTLTHDYELLKIKNTVTNKK